MSIETKPEEQAESPPPVPARMSTRVASRRRQRFRTLGAYLIVLGLLTVGFVIFEYWGTSYLTQRAQNHLRASAVAHGLIKYSVPDPQGVIKEERRPIPHAALGYLKIPRLHLDMVFVQGADEGSLRLGPGHYVGTPLPGQGGNVAIAGHRTTYLHPFWALNEMRKGDRITIETSNGVFVYRVEWVRIVLPHDTSVLASTARPSLTLTTCNPRFSAAQRLVVRARQISGPGLLAAAPTNTA